MDGRGIIGNWANKNGKRPEGKKIILNKFKIGLMCTKIIHFMGKIV